MYHQLVLTDHDDVNIPYGLYDQTTTELDIHNIANGLIQQCRVYELEFRQCDLNENLVKILLDKIRGFEFVVEIRKLSVTAHDNIENLLPVICELMKECGLTELNLEESDGSEDFLIILDQLIRRHQVKLRNLNLSYGENINFTQLATIISNDLTYLSLVNSHLQSKDFVALQLKNSKLQYLDISYNQLDEECMTALPALLCKDKAVTLIMKGCDLTPEEIRAFESFASIEVENLDLSYNTDMEPTGLKEVGCFVRKHNTKNVRLSACELDEDSLILLNKGLGIHELHSLDLSRNPGISSCYKTLTKVLCNSRVEEFNLSNCKMLSMQIRNLSEETGKRCATLKAIDLSDSNRTIVDVKYVNSIQSFVRYNPECREVKLVLPRLSGEDRKTLRNQLYSPCNGRFSE